MRPDLGGGITSSGSVAVMRRIISLFAMSPGTIAREPLRSLMASSRTSSRSFALRELSSAPWQLKHLLEMTGRIWELKSTGSEDDCLFGEAAGAVAINIQTVIVSMTSRTRCGKDLLIRSIQKGFWMIILHQTRRSWKASNLKRSGVHWDHEPSPPSACPLP